MPTYRSNRLVAIVPAAAALLLAAGAAPVLAAAPQTTGAGAAPAVEPARQEEPMTRKYCVEYQHSGTRIARKTCKSREEWIKETGVDPARK